jgi:hypothetical protein
VVPLESATRLDEQRECPPAGVLAGALAVSEAFQFIRHDTINAGSRELGLSLWRPEPEVDWRTADPGPDLDLLPAALWLIGLGHLGQAYLWTLGLLPYADPGAVELALQDVDALVEANDSTSPMTHRGLLGTKRRVFRTTIVERLFAANFHVADRDPRLALCGVDNPLARAQLERVGFKRVVEAGLGKGSREYLAMQLHTFPSSARNAEARWGGQQGNPETGELLLAKPAYRALAAEGLDDCGLTTLAGRSVGAPFVGMVASTLVIAEAVRIGLGDRTYAVIDASLRMPDRRRAIGNTVALEPFNPGVTSAVKS